MSGARQPDQSCGDCYGDMVSVKNGDLRLWRLSCRPDQCYGKILKLWTLLKWRTSERESETSGCGDCCVVTWEVLGRVASSFGVYWVLTCQVWEKETTGCDDCSVPSVNEDSLMHTYWLTYFQTHSQTPVERCCNHFQTLLNNLQFLLYRAKWPLS